MAPRGIGTFDRARTLDEPDLDRCNVSSPRLETRNSPPSRRTRRLGVALGRDHRRRARGRGDEQLGRGLEVDEARTTDSG